MVVAAHAAAGAAGSHILLRRLQRLLEALQQAKPVMLVGMVVRCGIMRCAIQHSAHMTVPALNCSRVGAATHTAGAACVHGLLRNIHCAKLCKLCRCYAFRLVLQLIGLCSSTMAEGNSNMCVQT